MKKSFNTSAKGLEKRLLPSLEGRGRGFIFLLIVMLFAACSEKASYEYPFQNPSLSVEERASDLVSRLTLDEKIAQMLNGAPAVERLGIPSYDWWNECLHGAGVNAEEYAVTVYPQAIGMAAGWDTEAIREMADYTAEEGRAVYNIAQSKGDHRIFRGLTFWSPNINIFRDPRWGRGQETYGEDPFLTASMGKNFVLGLQGNDKTYLKGAACAKHYAVHSGPESKRHIFNASVSSYDLWDTYLPAFETLVKEANVAGVMCAYNAYEGQPCCGSDKLLLDILRKEWGFTGYVTADCGAIDDFYKNHKTHANRVEAAADAVFHGTDVDCGTEAYLGLKQAVEEGIISEEQIDISLKRLFEIRFRLGMFEPKEKLPFAKLDSTSFVNEAHKAQALKMAKQSIVLLKNKGILPLQKAGLKKIALVGPNVNNPEVQLGNYNGFPKKSITPLLALQEKLPDVEIIQGLNGDLVDRTIVTPVEHAVTLPDGSGEGYTVAFFDNMDLQGEPVYTGTTEKIFFTSKEARQLLPGQHADEIAFAPGVPLSNFTSRFEGVFESPVSGPVEFKVTYDDGYRLYIDGKVVSERWNLRRGDWICTFQAQQGKKYALKLEHIQRGNHAKIQLDIQTRSLADFKPDMEKIKEADVIVFVGGLSPRIEGEEMTVSLPGFAGGDRTSILLPAVQIDLLKELKALGKPLVLVLMSGSALAFPEADGADAIIQAWYGGEFAGNAIADVLFGDYNPSGHLPVTFYASDDDLPDFEDYRMTNRTYKYFQGKALYPFGYGLSYTDFAYEWAKQPKKAYKPAETLQCSVTIRNTGKRDGDAVGQAYIKYPDGKGFPLKELRAFERKTIAQGKSHKMQVVLPLEKLAKWDDAAGKLLVPTGKYSIFIGSHSADEAVIADFEIK